ncbi:MAG TPA: DUF2461 domain-containing protein [Bacteroidales bacterium]|nr:DUF2461 domain-containing protein [Bacteroidales bacterium]
MNQINKSTLQFLSDLKRHNDRDWFSQNRKRYDEAKINYEAFVQGIIDEIALFDPIIKGLEVKSCTFRINRDIRFSADKSVYKTNMGAFIVRGGKKNGDKFPGYYIHVEPGNSFLAGGAHIPPAGWLSAIRQRIDERGDEFVKILNNKDFVKYFSAIEGDKLKTIPKGFPKEHRYADLLKFKSFLVIKSFTDAEITYKECYDEIIKAFRVMKPFNDFLDI